MKIKDKLYHLKSSLPSNVVLVAVSKTKPVSELMQAYDAGQRIFGENKVQEMTIKQLQMPKDVKWHMIGHLQRNKVKYLAPFVSLIHGVDSFKLLYEINKHAKKNNRIIDCLLQIKISDDNNKFGMSIEDAEALISLDDFENIKIRGLMGMASFVANEGQINKEFKKLSLYFDRLKKNKNEMDIISMGMSGDYKIAIDCGSTMIRIGSHIFGSRN
jgi:pyridoxal phosphate enzyme (YggS family)